MTKVVHTMTEEEEARWTGAPRREINGHGRSLLEEIEAQKPPRVHREQPRCIDCHEVVYKGPRCFRCAGIARRKLEPLLSVTCIDCGKPTTNPSRCYRCRQDVKLARDRLSAPAPPHDRQPKPETLALREYFAEVIPCNLQGCNEEATETGRCVRHEAIWLRMHAPATA